MKVIRFVSAVLILGLSLTQSLDAKTFKGLVFFDKNSNGVLDKGEKGMPGVPVSDGFSVVVTGKDGSFEIDAHPKTRFINVSTPDGYKNTNRFFYDARNDMAGTTVVENVLNKANPTLNFGLAKQTKLGEFAFMADVEDRTYMDWIDRMKEYVSTHNQDFVVVCGDICYESGLKFFPKAMNDDNMGCRVAFTVGNHDLLKGYKDYLGNPYAEKVFEDGFGPCWYSFTSAGTHFIVTPMLWGDSAPSYKIDEIMAWMRQDLANVPQGTPIVLFNHDAQQKLVPENANVNSFFYGHKHDDYRTVEEGITFYCAMSPSKASNDHSGSAFRQISYGKNGVGKTIMHYMPLSNHIVAHYANGKISAVIYDAASVPLKAEVISGNGKKIALHQVSDLLWEASAPAGFITEEPYKVSAQFSDGEIAITRQMPEPQLLWATILPCRTAFTNPIENDGHIYMAGVDNNNSSTCGIASLDAKTGNIEWFSATGNSINGDIAYFDGAIYAGDVDHVAYALDARTGRTLWTKRVGKTFYPAFSEGTHVADGKVYVGSAKLLTALDAKTGETVWKNQNSKHGSISNVCTNKTVNGALLTNGYWVGRFCYDAATGDLLWAKNDNVNRYCTCTPAVVDSCFLYTAERTMMKVEARSGNVVWSSAFNYIFNTRSEPLVEGGKIFVGTSDAGFVAIDEEKHSIAWRFQCDPALIYTSPYTKNQEKTVECSPVAYKDGVIFGANDGFIYCLKQDSGRFVWRIKIGTPVISKPLVIGDKMYINDFAGIVYCYDLSKL